MILASEVCGNVSVVIEYQNLFVVAIFHNDYLQRPLLVVNSSECFGGDDELVSSHFNILPNMRHREMINVLGCLVAVTFPQTLPSLESMSHPSTWNPGTFQPIMPDPRRRKLWFIFDLFRFIVELIQHIFEEVNLLGKSFQGVRIHYPAHSVAQFGSEGESDVLLV